MSKSSMLAMKMFVSAFHVSRAWNKEVTKHFSNTRGIKIIHQHVRGLFRNIGSLTLLLKLTKTSK